MQICRWKYSCSTSWPLRKSRLKPQWYFNTQLLEWFKKMAIPNVDKYAKKLDYLTDYWLRCKIV